MQGTCGLRHRTCANPAWCPQSWEPGVSPPSIPQGCGSQAVGAGIPLKAFSLPLPSEGTVRTSRPPSRTVSIWARFPAKPCLLIGCRGPHCCLMLPHSPEPRCRTHSCSRPAESQGPGCKREKEVLPLPGAKTRGLLPLLSGCHRSCPHTYSEHTCPCSHSQPPSPVEPARTVCLPNGSSKQPLAEPGPLPRALRLHKE